MTSHNHLNSAEARPLPEAAHRIALEMVDAGFVDTTMQFNIARVGSQFERGYDLINPKTNERVYVTSDTPHIVEGLVADIVGKNALLSRKSENAGAITYSVPLGSRLLRRTLETRPYDGAYMQALATRALDTITRLNRVNGLLGITLDHLAITHNGGNDEDDAILAVIPPFGPPPEIFEPESFKFITQHDRIINLLGASAVKEYLRDSPFNIHPDGESFRAITDAQNPKPKPKKSAAINKVDAKKIDKSAFGTLIRYNLPDKDIRLLMSMFEKNKDR